MSLTTELGQLGLDASGTRENKFHFKPVRGPGGLNLGVFEHLRGPR